MRNPFLKRWWVQRFNRLTGIVLFERDVDRTYWRRNSAELCAERLNAAMVKISRTDRFRVVEIKRG